MSRATVVTIFHRTDDPRDFTAVAAELRETASGATDLRVSILDRPHLDWGIAVSFSDPESLHAWLDGPARKRVLRAAAERGILVAAADLVITPDGVPPGIGVFRHTVTHGRELDFVSAEARLAETSAGFSGFEGCCAFLAAPDGADRESMAVLRFRTEPQLSAWLRSPERDAALSGLRLSLSREFSLVSSTTAFGTTVRTENGRTAITPRWKTAMLILLVLYPTVMLLSRFLGPVIDRLGAEPWLAMWVSQVVSVATLQWALMPWAGRWFQRWLDPVDGAGARTSALGAAAVIAGYAVTLTVFATVQWLQYWDYGPS